MTFGEEKKKRTLTPTEALAKIYNFCAYQERSHKEVKQKLYDYGLRSADVDQLLSRLITEGFVNEERFAKAFAGGKFRVKQWGRVKIENELNALGLSPRCITKGLNEIEEDDYLKTLGQVLEKKSALSSETDPFKKRNKLAQYAIARGFEPELVWKLIKENF